MKESELENLRYPIGHFKDPGNISERILTDWIAQLEALPVALEDLVGPLDDNKLDSPYRPGGWTVRQLVHHVADSHHNSYIRFKWALTEDTPVIKAYDQERWAELSDSKTAPVQMSIDHLKAVHARLVYLLRGLSKEQLSRTFIHPEGNKVTSLAENIGRYAWHGQHHYMHIKNLLQKEGWIIGSDKSPA